jgi:hypothetical protein
LPVDGQARDRHREAGPECGEAGHVSAPADRVADDDVVDPPGGNAAIRDHGGQHGGKQLLRGQ